MLSGFFKSLLSGRATFDGTERGAKIAKLLFVKYREDKICALAATVDETGFYWRSIENQADLKTALSDEHFALVLVDHPGTESEVLAYIETLRRSQVQANLFLLCGRLELPTITRAIRLGVRDLFHPPADVRAIIGRIHKLLPAVARADPGPQMEKWSALAAFLANADGPIVCGPSLSGGLGFGQRKIKDRAFAHLAFRPRAAAMAGDDAAHIGQANARPFEFFRAMQALEDTEQFVGVIHVEADAVIADK